MNTVGLSSVSIKSNNSKDFRALGRNSKSQSLCRDQRAVKSQLCINKLNFCKSFCSDVSVWGWVLLLVLCGKHSEGYWVSAIKKISACLWRAGAECYSLDQLCVVTTTVQLFPGTSQPQSRDTPLLLLTPHGPAVQPALTSLLPALCHCPHPRRATCSGASAAPEGQGSPQPWGMLCAFQFAHCPALMFSFPTQLWVSSRGPAAALHCSPGLLCAHGCGSANSTGGQWLQIPCGRGYLWPRGWPAVGTVRRGSQRHLPQATQFGVTNLRPEV